MTHLNEGDPAPDFTLHRDDGTAISSQALAGHPIVLFFYPEDDSGGCVDENQEFSALSDAFSVRDTFLVGVSPDTSETHKKFREKYGLKVPLAADPQRKIIEAFGLWQMKKLYGREFMGLVRTSIIIDQNGRIARIIRATRIKGHAAKMLEALDEVIAGEVGA
ncbi:peroxiredoxin [Devosia aurantiaca]|uniref:thioredoxin-dependent peroxiredoxin n=1 Tax=Devosia aurantiaca TaxID=2714858 RepID=A0A6M1SV13_9HYPH|nr:peroxiredoxin [Devosia aurantiaca]NGP19222.1 peroxiredoxin [Devosia aurantiaca]